MRLWRRSDSADRDGRDFRVELHHREVFAYYEGDRGVLFDAAWGAKPRTLFVPAEDAWDDVVPEWLRGRRDVVVRRLARATKHRIEPTDDPMRTELRPVSAEEARAIGTAFLDGMVEVIGPWTIESFEEREDGWQLSYRLLEPDRYAPALPDGTMALLLRRDTGQVEVL